MMKFKQIFRTFMFATLLCGVVAAVSSCKDDEVTELPVTATVAGTVTDGDDAPLAGVKVTLSGGDLTIPKTVITAADGTYVIGNVPVAGYDLSFTKTNYVSVDTSVAAGDFNKDGVITGKDVTVLLSPTATYIVGTVTDSSDGKPLAGVTVVVKAGDQRLDSLVTAADGTYTAACGDKGEFNVTFKMKNYADLKTGVVADDFTSRVATLDVAMDKAYEIFGYVVESETGTELEGVTVVATDGDGEEVGTAITDEDGAYSVLVLAAASYTLTFTLDGYESATTKVVKEDFGAVYKNVALVDDIELTVTPAAAYLNGTVTDADDETPVEGVSVVVLDGADEEVGAATTGEDGAYSIPLDAVASYKVVFSKEGYIGVTEVVPARDFVETIATVNVTLVNTSYKIIGKTVNTAAAAVAGVAVTATDANNAKYTVTSGADGTFAIEGLLKGDYSVAFVLAGYPDVTPKTVAAADFTALVADLGNVDMGTSPILLPGMTKAALLQSPKLYYNWYRSGNNSGVLWDWSTCYAPAQLPTYGTSSTNGGGLSFTTSGTTSNANDFQSYLYGSKKITADNKILSVKAVGSNSGVQWGVQVVDLSAATPAAVKIGANTTTGTTATDYSFDLTSYVDKEVIIAIGVYNAGTASRSIRLRSIMFAPAAYTGTAFPTIAAGDEVTGLDGWQLTKATVKSTMVQEKTRFSGRSMTTGSDPALYKSVWYNKVEADNAYHIGKEWSFVPVIKDAEPMINEGMLIKTHASDGDQSGNSTTPHAYGYAKFAITDANAQMTLWARTFGGRNPFFKVTVISEDGTSATHLAPTGTTAGIATIGTNGAWKLIFDGGDIANVSSYGKLTYDLSAYKGKNVVIAIGVYTGTGATGDEFKFVFRQIEFGPKQ